MKSTSISTCARPSPFSVCIVLRHTLAATLHSMRQNAKRHSSNVALLDTAALGGENGGSSTRSTCHNAYMHLWPPFSIAMQASSSHCATTMRACICFSRMSAGGRVRRRKCLPPASTVSAPSTSTSMEIQRALRISPTRRQAHARATFLHFFAIDLDRRIPFRRQ